MTNPGPITVGFDGSPDSRRAARWAAGLAATHPGVSIHLVHALAMPAIPADFWDLKVQELFARQQREIDAELERERAELAAAGLPVEVFVRRWQPLETLLEHARTHASDLLVVGQHGTGRSRALLGGVSDSLARQAELPVVVDRGRESPAPPRTVLLASDGSPASSRAAGAVARWFPAARVRLVRVGPEGEPPSEAELRAWAERAGLAAERLELRVAEGRAAEALLALADEPDVDLVAAGRRGRSAWTELLLGGVAAKLVELSPHPVLLAH